MRTPEQLKVFLNTPRHVQETGEITPGKIGALRGHLQMVCDTDPRRRTFLRYIFGTDTTNNLAAGHWLNLNDWMQPFPTDTDNRQVWTVRGDCLPEADAVIAAQHAADRQATISSGQLTLF